MKLHFLGTGAGLPSKTRFTQCIILDCVEEINEYYMIDACEGVQHQMLHTYIKPAKVTRIFITHLHGDHIYGLPGFLASRVNLGGEGVPLTIYGPVGLKAWLDITLNTSQTSLNYPLEIIEIQDETRIDVGHFNVSIYPLDHNIESYMYVFLERDKEGELHADKLIALGIEPGPIYSEIKGSLTFTHNGKTYHTSDFTGAQKPGRKVVVHGDTRPVNSARYYELIDNATVIVHESTFLNGEKEKAHRYFHSEISGVLQNLTDLRYQQLILTHISNRYDVDYITRIKDTLPHSTMIAEDLLEVTIPRT